MDSPVQPKVQELRQVPTASLRPTPNRVSLSLPLTPESSELREELARVAVMSLEERFVNKASIQEIIPSILKRDLLEPITPLNNCAFLVLLTNREEVKEVCKMESFKVATKDAPCVLKLAPWLAELGAMGRASGDGQWVSLWNLPLHAWS